MSVTLTDLMSTPVSEIDPERNPIADGEHLIYLDKVRTDMSNDDSSKVYRYSCTFKIADGDYQGRVFFDDIYPTTKAGAVNPVATKQVKAIIEGALGNLEAVAGRQDIGEVLEEIAAANPPLTFTMRTKNETFNNRNRTRLAV